MANRKKLSEKVIITISILFCLIILTAGALTARYIFIKHLEDKTVTTVITDNLIGEKSEVFNQNISSFSDAENNSPQATTVKLYKNKALTNEKLQVHNMMPGDNEVEYFAVKVNHHKNVDVFFNSEVTEQSKKLAEVLNIKITCLKNSKILYNGSFANMKKEGYSENLTSADNNETVVYYKIDVSLPTSVNNEYQAASLFADFNWYVKDTDALVSPHTDDKNNIILWLIMMISFLIIMKIVLSRLRENKENENAEEI